MTEETLRRLREPFYKQKIESELVWGCGGAGTGYQAKGEHLHPKHHEGATAWNGRISVLSRRHLNPSWNDRDYLRFISTRDEKPEIECDV